MHGANYHIAWRAVASPPKETNTVERARFALLVFQSSWLQAIAIRFLEFSFFFGSLDDPKSKYGDEAEVNPRPIRGHPGPSVAKDQFNTRRHGWTSSHSRPKKTLIFTKQNKLPDRKLGKDRVGIIDALLFVLCARNKLSPFVATWTCEVIITVNFICRSIWVYNSIVPLAVLRL